MVSNILYFHHVSPLLGEMTPMSTACFSNGLVQPPTSIAIHELGIRRAVSNQSFMGCDHEGSFVAEVVGTAWRLAKRP